MTATSPAPVTSDKSRAETKFSVDEKPAAFFDGDDSQVVPAPGAGVERWDSSSAHTLVVSGWYFPPRKIPTPVAGDYDLDEWGGVSKGEPVVPFVGSSRVRVNKGRLHHHVGNRNVGILGLDEAVRWIVQQFTAGGAESAGLPRCGRSGGASGWRRRGERVGQPEGWGFAVALLSLRLQSSTLRRASTLRFIVTEGVDAQDFARH